MVDKSMCKLGQSGEQRWHICKSLLNITNQMQFSQFLAKQGHRPSFPASNKSTLVEVGWDQSVY